MFSLSGIFWIIIVIIIFIIGVAGIILPVIPSLPVIWFGILLYAIITDFENINVAIVVVTGVLMFIGTLLDIIAGVLGVKIYGASWWGTTGAFVGTLVGMIMFNILGMLIGAFVGALLGEYLRYKKTDIAFKAGVGTIVGFIVGVVLKIVIAFVMIGIFFLKLLFF